jgi:hypothetical protein
MIKPVYLNNFGEEMNQERVDWEKFFLDEKLLEIIHKDFLFG